MICLGFSITRLAARAIGVWKRRNKEGEKAMQWKMWNHGEFQRHNGDLSVKGETGSVKGETKSGNFKGKCKLIIGSAEALPILCVRYFRWERERERYRERERDGSDVTIVALKLAMNTLSLAKNSHNWRWVYTFPCKKFALFVSPFTLPVSPFTERSPLWRWNSQWVHTFHCQKFFRRFVPPLSNGTSRTTSDRKPKTNDQILPSPILFFPLKNWIKLIPKTIGNRKRDCAWGGSGW